MSLLASSMSEGGTLLAHRHLSWSRSRPTAGTRDSETGAPTPGTPSTSTFKAWFSWLSEREKQDYQADAAAILLTPPGALQGGDTVTNVGLGRFVVLDGGVKNMGEHDRVEVRRSA